jgi:hypothetical protein
MLAAVRKGFDGLVLEDVPEPQAGDARGRGADQGVRLLRDGLQGDQGDSQERHVPVHRAP